MVATPVTSPTFDVRETAGNLAPQHIQKVMQAYGDRHSAGDIDGILALFADDAWIRDPANESARQGKDALRAFFQAGVKASNGPFEMKLDGAVRVAGNQGAAAFIVRTIHTAPISRVETLDVMTFNDDGLITEMLAFWGPVNFRQE